MVLGDEYIVKQFETKEEAVRFVELDRVKSLCRKASSTEELLQEVVERLGYETDDWGDDAMIHPQIVIYTGYYLREDGSSYCLNEDGLSPEQVEEERERNDKVMKAFEDGERAIEKVIRTGESDIVFHSGSHSKLVSE